MAYLIQLAGLICQFLPFGFQTGLFIGFAEFLPAFAIEQDGRLRVFAVGPVGQTNKLGGIGEAAGFLQCRAQGFIFQCRLTLKRECSRHLTLLNGQRALIAVMVDAQMVQFGQPNEPLGAMASLGCASLIWLKGAFADKLVHVFLGHRRSLRPKNNGHGLFKILPCMGIAKPPLSLEQKAQFTGQ